MVNKLGNLKMKTLIYFVKQLKNAINLSNLYPIGGPAFLLTQVHLVCPWVLHNGQITALGLHTVGATIDCDSILFFLFLPLIVSTVGCINGTIQKSLIKFAHKGESPSAYICLKYSTV